MTRVARIVSGGQTGADRAGLDVAIAIGLEYGGWCPRGGWAEDLPDPPGLLVRYPRLEEAPAPSARTRLNVRDSHATLIVRATSSVSPGTDLTEKTAERLGRPYLVTTGDTPAEVSAWLDNLGSELTLNVAGPRESQDPGVYRRTFDLLTTVLRG